MNKRDEIRAFLRAQWDGVTVGRVSEQVGETYDKVYDHLKNLKKRGEVEQDDMRRWYWRRANGIVPEHVDIIRRPEPDVAAVEEHVLAAEEEPQVYYTPECVIEAASGVQPLDEPEVIRELAEHLDRLSVVPAAELERPAPPVEQMVTLKLKVPASVARQILALVP